MPNYPQIMQIMFLRSILIAVGILLSYFQIVLPLVNALISSNREREDKRFQNYHRLIDEMVGRQGSPPMRDRQIAIIFEMRFFKKYYPVTKRILSALKTDWSSHPHSRVLVNEIDLTINYIEASWLKRAFIVE